MVARHIQDLNMNSAVQEKNNKVRFDIVKAGFEALKGNYYKAATEFVNASKD